MKITRRDLLRACIALGIGIPRGVSASDHDAEGRPTERPKQLERRPLGKTGEKLSIIGLGGIVIMGIKQKQANEIVARSVDRGVNYFDVAPSYGDAELRLGPALKPYRKKSFLACKSTQRDKSGIRTELERSLKRLKTDYVDLYQLHGISSVEGDVEPAFGPGGAMEAVVAAQKEGLIRFIGFSAHSVEAALEAIKRFPFDTILYPINYVCHFAGNFDQKVIEAARSREMGILALKAMARTLRTEGHKRHFPKCWYEPTSDESEAALALRWTLSQPVTAAVPPGDESLFWLATQIASEYAPVKEPEVAQLRESAAKLEPIFKYTAKE